MLELEDGADDLERAAVAVRAAPLVDVESEASAKTDSDSRHVNAVRRAPDLQPPRQPRTGPGRATPSWPQRWRTACQAAPAEASASSPTPATAAA
jgi:hypothetical protein